MKIYRYIKNLIRNYKRIKAIDGKGFGLWWDGIKFADAKKIRQSNRIFNFVRGKK